VKKSFATKTANSEAKGTATKSTAATRSKKQKTAQIFHDDKLLQAVCEYSQVVSDERVAAILYGSCKRSDADWKKAILECDEALLPGASELERLRAALPPPETLKQLAAATPSQLELMPEGEKLLATLASINALPLRLDLLSFKLTLREMIDDLKPVCLALLLHPQAFRVWQR